MGWGYECRGPLRHPAWMPWSWAVDPGCPSSLWAQEPRNVWCPDTSPPGSSHLAKGVQTSVSPLAAAETAHCVCNCAQTQGTLGEWPRGALLRGYVSQTSSEMPQRWGEARDTPRPFYEIAHLRVSCVL